MPRVPMPRPHMQTEYARWAGESEYPGLWTNLEAAWPFGMIGSGTRIYDLSRRHPSFVFNNATLMSYVPGRAGKALDMASDSNSFINIGTGFNNIPSNNFSIFFWANADAYAANEAGFGWSGTDDLVIYPNSSTSSSGPRVFWRDVGAITIGAGNQTGKWNHIGLVSVTTTLHRLYLNATNSGNTTGNRNNSNGFQNDAYIGGWEGSSSQRFNGKMDELYIYTRALEQSEIDILYEISYAPFIPRRRIYGFTVAGAPAFPPNSLALTGVGR